MRKNSIFIIVIIISSLIFFLLGFVAGNLQKIEQNTDTDETALIQEIEKYLGFQAPEEIYAYSGRILEKNDNNFVIEVALPPSSVLEEIRGETKMAQKTVFITENTEIGREVFLSDEKLEQIERQFMQEQDEYDRLVNQAIERGTEWPEPLESPEYVALEPVEFFELEPEDYIRVEAAENIKDKTEFEATKIIIE
jgi:uncharacterized protein YpmB